MLHRSGAGSAARERAHDREVVAALVHSMRCDECGADRRPQARGNVGSWPAAHEGIGLSELNKQHASLVGVLGESLGNYTGIGWTGTTHTSDMTLVMTVSARKELFAGLAPNTAAFERMTKLMGVEFKNPRMSVEKGSRYPSLDLSKPHWEG